MLGRIYYQEGFIPEAAGQFERVLRIDPKAYKAWDNLGLCDQALGDKKKAIQHFLTAINLVEQIIRSTTGRTRIWRICSRRWRCRAGVPRGFFEGGRRNPDIGPKPLHRGQSLDKLGKTETAINWLQRSASLDPDYGEPLCRLSIIYHRLARGPVGQMKTLSRCEGKHRQTTTRGKRLCFHN